MLRLARGSTSRPEAHRLLHRQPRTSGQGTGVQSRGKAGRPAAALAESEPMTPIRVMLVFFDGGFLFKLILALLAWSLVPLGEIFLFIFLASLIGNSLVLIFAAVAGVVGVCAGISQARRAASRLRAALANGSYPGRDAVELGGLLVSAVLLITPGFVTDAAGFLLLVPSLRVWVGRRLALVLEARFRDVYDRLRLSAL